jgi:diguanylate cyclase (GGDEF)-like protein
MTADQPRKKRGFRLGLAGRVAVIGCAAAIAATLSQWAITPVLAAKEIKFQRETAVNSAARTLSGVTALYADKWTVEQLKPVVDALSEALPQGQALVYDHEWRLMGQAGDNVPALSKADLQRLAATPGKPFENGPRIYTVNPVMADDHTVGYAVFSFQPRTIPQMWLGIVWRNALVLVLALCVIAPFLFPLARKALAPLVRLEKEIRNRSASDKSKLSEGVDDNLLKPLLAAIDEVHDRSEAATKRALRIAFADPVTRLPNRLRFMSRLDALVDRHADDGVFLVIGDIDGFRKINLTHGPRAADQVLAAIAERLRACTAQFTTGAFMLGRVGTDQFGVIATGVDRALISAFLVAAERALAEPMEIEDQKITAAMSFGVAVTPDDAVTAPDLVKQAEVALKEAKRSTGPRRAFFDARLLEKERRQARLEEELREGLQKGEFIAVFQPKVKLETGDLVGAEALARWRRPDGMVVSPGVFVPMAEELGLISQLGACVLHDACHAAAAWNRNGANVRIAVNVSPYQLNDPDFVGVVHQALDDSGLDPRLLELEITESAAVNEPEKVARTMWPLRNRGVRLAIDDFGTGHSNFKSLTVLPFDVFKIDQQFVRALATDAQAPAIVEMILAMAESMGQETVAEGVETREQADFLLRRNCTIGQGYYFSPPLPADEFDAFLRSWRPRPANRFAA